MPIPRFFAVLALLGATSCLTKTDSETNAQKATTVGYFPIAWRDRCLVPWGGSYVAATPCEKGGHLWGVIDTGLSVMLSPWDSRNSLKYLTSGGGYPGYWLTLDLPERVLESRADQQWVFQNVGAHLVRLQNLDTGLCAEVGSDFVLTQNYCGASEDQAFEVVLPLPPDGGVGGR
jgi:hypothetical protein